MEVLHPYYLHLDMNNIDHQEESDSWIQNIYRKIDLPDLKAMKEKTRWLDPFQRNVIDIGVQFCQRHT